MIAQNAESARGISPEPLTDPDVNLSIHPARASHRRLPHSVKGKEFLRLPVDSNSTWMTCPLRSVGNAPRLHYYETVRPCPADRYFRPHGAFACAFSLSTACRFSSSVLEPGIESRHLCTGLRCTSRYRCTGWGLPLSPTASASRSDVLTRLNTRHARSLVNVSTPPSRAAPHDSGPMWVANSHSNDSYIHYTSPV
jgi:hypothetical protein